MLQHRAAPQPGSHTSGVSRCCSNLPMVPQLCSKAVGPYLLREHHLQEHTIVSVRVPHMT